MGIIKKFLSDNFQSDLEGLNLISAFP